MTHDSLKKAQLHMPPSHLLSLVLLGKKNHPKKLLISCCCSEMNPSTRAVAVGFWWLGIRWIQGWLGLVCAEFIENGVCRRQAAHPRECQESQLCPFPSAEGSGCSAPLF